MKTLFGIAFGGITGLIIGILIGALALGGFTFLQSGGTSVPYDTGHNTIAQGFTVVDTTWSHELNLKHLQTGPAEFSPYAPLDLFTAHNTYTQSIWMFTSGDDADLFMAITGPGDDGQSYYVTFSRCMANGVEITGWSQKIAWGQGSADGMATVIVAP